LFALKSIPTTHIETDEDYSFRYVKDGHLEKMEEDRMPKKIFTQELEGTRRRGRPR